MTSLNDSYNRKIDYLRLSVTDKCNLRCIYCVPAQGLKLKPRKDILTYEEIELFANCVVEEGISRIRLTGGEPLIRRDILSLVRNIASIPGLKDFSLTTNGFLLADYADMLMDAGLNRINISIDSLDPSIYKFITRVGELDRIMNGLAKALESGFNPVKINVVVLRGINDDISDFVKLIYEYPVHVRFIEYMPFGTEIGPEKTVNSCELKERIERFGKLRPVEAMRGAGPARYFEMKGALGTLGFISPISEHFCANCNRLRLTAEGRLRSCLFLDDEINVREALRSDASKENIRRLIKRALLKKPKNSLGYGHDNLQRQMSQIGG